MNDETPIPLEENWRVQTLLERLRKGPASTLELQHDLPFPHVARQVWEMRHWYGMKVHTGRLPNNIALYTLVSEVQPVLWTKTSKTEALLAKDAGKAVKFTLDGWMVEGGDADERGPDLPSDTTSAADLTKEAAAIFMDMTEYTHEMQELGERVGGGPTPLQHDKKTGVYSTPWRECECGEQYLVHMEHERTSVRHKTWATGGIEVPVPPQPLVDMYQKGTPTPKLEMGVNKICTRCGAKDKKGEDYYPDRDSRADRRFPCRRCNGHGVIPNVGPA